MPCLDRLASPRRRLAVLTAPGEGQSKVAGGSGQPTFGGLSVQALSTVDVAFVLEA